MVNELNCYLYTVMKQTHSVVIAVSEIFANTG